MTEPLEFCIVLLATVVVINIWLSWRVLYPLRRLARQANQLTAGEFTALETSCGGIAEIESLRRSMVAMVSHVRRSQEQSHVYADVLTRGQEAERTRIARELHDETVQLFIAIAQETDLVRALVEKQPTNAVELLKTIRTLAVDAVDNLRHLIADLRPPALEELGLVAALKMLAETSNPAKIQVTVEGIERRLKEEYELTFFRIAQEAVTNAERHGGAKTIDIKVGYEPQQIALIIEDDGSGFAVPADVNQIAANGHYGLLGIHERVQALKGNLKISQRRSTGTQIMVTVPSAEVGQPLSVVHDPVCKAEVKPHQAYGSIQYEGMIYYFCCPVCQGAFQQDPNSYTVNRSQLIDPI